MSNDCLRQGCRTNRIIKRNNELKRERWKKEEKKRKEKKRTEEVCISYLFYIIFFILN